MSWISQPLLCLVSPRLIKILHCNMFLTLCPALRGDRASLAAILYFLPEPEGAWAWVLSCDIPSAAPDVPCRREIQQPISETIWQKRIAVAWQHTVTGFLLRKETCYRLE